MKYLYHHTVLLHQSVLLYLPVSDLTASLTLLLSEWIPIAHRHSPCLNPISLPKVLLESAHLLKIMHILVCSSPSLVLLVASLVCCALSFLCAKPDYPLLMVQQTRLATLPGAESSLNLSITALGPSQWSLILRWNPLHLAIPHQLLPVLRPEECRW